MLIAYHLHLSYSPLSFGIFQHHPKPFWQATATVKKCHCSVPEGLFLLLPSAALCVGWMNKYISECSACPHQIKALGLWTRSWWSLQRHSSCGAIQMELKEANTFCLSNIIFEVECWGATGGGMVCITWLIVGFQAQWAMALGGTSYNADVSGRSRTVSGDLLKSVIRLFTKAWRERTGDRYVFHEDKSEIAHTKRSGIWAFWERKPRWRERWGERPQDEDRGCLGDHSDMQKEEFPLRLL